MRPRLHAWGSHMGHMSCGMPNVLKRCGTMALVPVVGGHLARPIQWRYHHDTMLTYELEQKMARICEPCVSQRASPHGPATMTLGHSSIISKHKFKTAQRCCGATRNGVHMASEPYSVAARGVLGNASLQAQTKTLPRGGLKTCGFVVDTTHNGETLSAPVAQAQQGRRRVAGPAPVAQSQ